MIEWLITPHWPYWLTAILCSLAVGMALRAFVALRKRRKALARYLLGVGLVGAGIGLSTVWQAFPPISPALTLLALLMVGALWELGVEPYEVEVPAKSELERLLSEGLRGPIIKLSQQQYELAADYIRLEAAKTGHPLPPERLKVLANVARFRR